MKKVTIAFISILAILWMAGCERQVDDRANMAYSAQIPEEVQMMEVSPELDFRAKFSSYTPGTNRIWMELENRSTKEIRFPREYFLEAKTEKGWDLPLIDGQKDFGEVDAGSVQFPIEPGEKREIGIYIGALGRYDKDYEAYRIPCGLYRVTMVSDTKDKVTGEFEISNQEPEDDTRPYYLEMTPSVYTKNTDKITYKVVNDSDREIGYGAPFHIEQFVNGIWKVYPMKKEEQEFIAIGYICMPHSANEETINLGQYYKLPLEAGRYRLVKQLDVYRDSYAEFTISNIDENIAANETGRERKRPEVVGDRLELPDLAIEKVMLRSFGANRHEEIKDREIMNELIELLEAGLPKEKSDAQLPSGISLHMDYEGERSISVYTSIDGNTVTVHFGGPEWVRIQSICLKAPQLSERLHDMMQWKYFDAKDIKDVERVEFENEKGTFAIQDIKVIEPIVKGLRQSEYYGPTKCAFLSKLDFYCKDGTIIHGVLSDDGCPTILLNENEYEINDETAELLDQVIREKGFSWRGE